MARPFVSEWIQLIRPLFPKSARIEIDPDNDLVLRIDWKLGNDPLRPNKRSRLIRLILHEKAIQDYPDVKAAGSRIRKLVQEKLCVFNPDHNTRRCGTRPVEEWVLSPSDMG
jgi:hypothetical protein